MKSDSPHRGLHTQMSALLEDEANKYAELSKFLPPVDHPEYSTKRNWAEHLSTHRYTVAADFVARVGYSMYICL